MPYGSHVLSVLALIVGGGGCQFVQTEGRYFCDSFMFDKPFFSRTPTRCIAFLHPFKFFLLEIVERGGSIDRTSKGGVKT